MSSLVGILSLEVQRYSQGCAGPMGCVKGEKGHWGAQGDQDSRQEGALRMLQDGKRQARIGGA